MAKKYTHENFVKDVCKRLSEYVLLDRYVNMKTKIKVKHNVCGHIYSITPDNFKRGRNCPECSKEKFKVSLSSTLQEVKDAVFKIVGKDYEVLDDKYINARTPIKMKHTICGNEWSVRPNHFIKNGTRCPKCADRLVGLSNRKSQDDFYKEVSEITNDEYEVVGKYVNAITKIDIIHHSCNKIYNVEPNSFLSGNRCGHCKSSISKGEREIIRLLELRGLDYVYQFSFDDCKYKKPLPFDFAVFNNGKLNYLIEFDGRQHYEAIDAWGGEEEFERIKMCDDIKNKYCKSNNIKLIRIPHWDYENIESILGKCLYD